MRFLLVGINAKYIHSNPAIYSLRAFAGEEFEKNIELAEYTINQQMQEILGNLYERKPDVIGLSCYIWNWKLVKELIPELNKLLPHTDLWLGGPEVTYDAHKILGTFPQLKGIIVGEGEVTFRELLCHYVRGTGALEEIPGLCLATGYTAPRALTDLSKIPFFYQNPEPFENRIIYYESSRGCPYRCSYCLSSIDKQVRFRDISVVKKELQFFLDHRVKQVKFVDRTFNCNHEHAMEIWRYISEHDNGVTNFHFEISADILREDEIALLHTFRPGLAQLEIGVQSVNPATIKAINRVMDVDKLERNVAAIRSGNNIHQHLDLIAGLPYEDFSSFRTSFNRVYGMRPQQLALGFLKVLKGSEMYEKASEYGIVYTEMPPYEVMYTKWLSYRDVLHLKKIEEMVEIYYNSGQFTRTLQVLERAFESPFDLFDRLAGFYREKGYFLHSPARVYRYHILLQFAETVDSGKSALYAELLTCDLYLRENLKTRPDFATDLAPYRTGIRELSEAMKLPGTAHIEPFFYPVWEERLLSTSDTGTVPERNADSEELLPSGEPTFVVFDYRSRNPLNREASVTCIRN